MKTRFYLLLFFLFTIINNAQEQTGSFTVGGDTDKYYPVTFYDGGWDYNVPTEMSIGRSNVHTNAGGGWRGTIMSVFKFHTNNWGHMSYFIKPEILSSHFHMIAGWQDATFNNSIKKIIIWFKGGGLTYFYKSNYTVDPVVYDGIANELPFNEQNGPAHSYKTAVESYVTNSNLAFPKNSLITEKNDKVGIGTTEPSTKLDVRGIISTPEIAFRNSDGSDDSDPYRLRKVQGSSNNNWLELQLNDDPDESFRIYGNSCDGFSCGEYSNNLYHSFDAQGNVFHRGKIGIGTTTPHAKLHIYDNPNLTEMFLGENASNNKAGILKYIQGNQNQIGRLQLGNWGDDLDNVGFNIIKGGNVGIGTINPQNKLSVDGTIWAKAVKVSLTDAADWVFDKNYKLRSLAEVEKYINQNKHLPEVPSAEEFRQNDLNVSEMTNKLLQKIEELTLYMIQLKKENEILNKKMDILESKSVEK